MLLKDKLSSDLYKTTLGTRFFGDQTEFDIDFYVTMAVMVKLLNLAKIANGRFTVRRNKYSLKGRSLHWRLGAYACSPFDFYTKNNYT